MAPTRGPAGAGRCLSSWLTQPLSLVRICLRLVLGALTHLLRGGGVTVEVRMVSESQPVAGWASLTASALAETQGPRDGGG